MLKSLLVLLFCLISVNALAMDSDQISKAYGEAYGRILGTYTTVIVSIDHCYKDAIQREGVEEIANGYRKINQPIFDNVKKKFDDLMLKYTDMKSLSEFHAATLLIKSSIEKKVVKNIVCSTALIDIAEGKADLDSRCRNEISFIMNSDTEGEGFISSNSLLQNSFDGCSEILLKESKWHESVIKRYCACQSFEMSVLLSTLKNQVKYLKSDPEIKAQLDIIGDTCKNRIDDLITQTKK